MKDCTPHYKLGSAQSPREGQEEPVSTGYGKADSQSDYPSTDFVLLEVILQPSYEPSCFRRLIRMPHLPSVIYGATELGAGTTHTLCLILLSSFRTVTAYSSLTNHVADCFRLRYLYVALYSTAFLVMTMIDVFLTPSSSPVRVT